METEAGSSRTREEEEVALINERVLMDILNALVLGIVMGGGGTYFLPLGIIPFPCNRRLKIDCSGSIIPDFDDIDKEKLDWYRSALWECLMRGGGVIIYVAHDVKYM